MEKLQDLLLFTARNWESCKSYTVAAEELCVGTGSSAMARTDESFSDRSVMTKVMGKSVD